MKRKRLISVIVLFGGLQAYAADVISPEGTEAVASPTPREVTIDLSGPILPQDTFTITVRNACAGTTYTLYRSDSDTPVKSAAGTGSDLNFTGAFGAGTYTVKDHTGLAMKNTVSANLYWPLVYNFSKVEMNPLPPFNANGGVIDLDLYTAYGPTIDHMIALFDRYNAGDSPSWSRNMMRITVEDREIIDEGRNYIFHAKVYCGPNLSSSSRYNYTNINAFGSLSCYSILQNGGGELTDWSMRIEPNLETGGRITLDNTQYLVFYELYNCGELVASELQEPRKKICFDKLGPGLYTVKAVNRYYISAEREHDEVCKIQLDKYIQQKPLITYDKAFGPVLEKSGGTIVIACSKNKYIDNATINRVIAEFNAENEGFTMRLAKSTETTCDIELKYPGNFSDRSRDIDSKFIFFKSGSKFRFGQSGTGDITVYDVTYGTMPEPYIRLSGSQEGVVYTVLKQGQTIGLMTLSGTGEPLMFTGIPLGSVYMVRGIKTGQVVFPEGRMQCDMNGKAVMISDPEDRFSDGANVISEKTFYDESHSYADITYYNGLGTPDQTIRFQAAKNGRSLVTPVVYDEMDRENAMELLPFAAERHTAEYVKDAEFEQTIYYSQRNDNLKDGSAFVLNVFDRSGLDRIERSYRPGDIYRKKDKYTQYLYATNEEQDRVFDFRYDFDDGSVSVSGYLEESVLLKNTVIDEDGHKTESFTNSDGQLILERHYLSDAEYTDTYRVYDPFFGLLRWVVPPEASSRLTVGQKLFPDDDSARRYCYGYSYDGRGNLIERRIPGRETEEFVYDNSDRRVFSRDGNLREHGQWIYHVYDNAGNLLRQNLLDCNLSRATLQARYERLDGNLYPELGGADNQDLPGIVPEAVLSRRLIYNIYGNTQYVSAGTGFEEAGWTVPDALAFVADSKYRKFSLENPVNLKTYERLAVLDLNPEAEAGYVERAYYYDYKNRPIQIVERNPRGGISRTCHAYDNMGNVLHSREICQPYEGAPCDTLCRECDYDNRRRLIREVWTLNGNAPVAVDYAYDDQGRLTEKSVAQPQSVFKEELEYNIQGWLTGRFNNDFSTKLRYYDPVRPESLPLYAGNISETQWGHEGRRIKIASIDFLSKNAAAPAGELFGPYPFATEPIFDTHAYSYRYDALQRLVAYEQYGKESLADSCYVERGIAYDGNGNVLTLERTADGRIVDRLNYTYDGNRLVTLDRNGTKYDYAYDANGNCIKDGLNNLQITYNFLNLLEEVTRDGALMAGYVYAADGVKLSVRNASGYGYDYLGSLVYETDAAGCRLESAAFSAGRFVREQTQGGTAYVPHYFQCDHLGSLRAISDDSKTVLERNDYYAFGGRWRPDGSAAQNRWLFNGKESQKDFGFGFLDFGARMFDPATGRWITQEPLVEKYFPISPYAYCGNNPILRIDPDGQKWVDANGNSVWENGKWTQYATPQIQELGNVLKSTITGQQQFEKLINNPANIQVTINDTDKPHIYGHMNPKGGVIFNKETGKYRINSDAEIVIYKLNAEDRANKSQGLLTHLEAMAVNLGHEIEHTTDENIELNANNASKTERERKPDAISQKLKREYEMQKPIITDEKIF